MVITTERAVVCLVSEPVPVGYLNVYEQGDVWLKIVGCEGCPPEAQKKCCGNCPLLLKQGGCIPHLEGTHKPFDCMIVPPPDMTYSFCQLEFECVKGTNKGKVRKIREPGHEFVEASA